MIASCEKCTATLVAIPDPEMAGAHLFRCGSCGHLSKTANIAKSHCCQETVERSGDERFPFVCSRCGGACEFADPKTPTFEQDVVDGIRYVVTELKAGKMHEPEAVAKLWTLCKERTEHRAEAIAIKIAQSVERQMPVPLYMPGHGETQALEAVCKGYELAVNVLFREIDRIIK